MRLGIQLGYSGEGFAADVDEVVEYEEAGAELVVVPEAYSFDAVSRLGFLAARTRRMGLASGVMQLYTRTPTLTAMTAAGIDYVSGGRFSLGLGASGPQVIEGFHGVRYDAPVARTREIVEICRRVWRRETLVFEGDHYRIPRPGEYAKPLKLINHPVRPRIPVLLAAMGPRNVALAAEIAEGWQALWLDPRAAGRVFGDALADGRSRRDPALGPLDISVPVPFALREQGLDRHRAQLALYLGGMGARGRNFSNDLVRRYGYADAATRIQELYLSGRRAEAVAAVPEDLVAATSLTGPPDEIRRRLDALAGAGVTTLLVSPLAAERAERVKDVQTLATLLATR
ncbi:LLM class F420-dependent oxidoreductase [Actinoplanes sp. NEAU-H7]|uniref:LLM class F420-dependent oxidoreductase n=1 Tax=Actinoplanes flavus TaxID=2820290 RepID=A0ABS3UDJ1_9ACTN|nr:LLM class F420-dependent oxidoreductase [Actinoplanes flavus]MBO3736840.1 LLM class F420-dependent oxidoreductase [Actinoplanes flavus]